MFLPNVTNIAFDEFSQVIQDKKAVLIYPQSRCRNLFLAYFLRDAKATILYYRLPHDFSTLFQFLAALLDSLEDEWGTFATETRAALPRRQAAAAADALAQDLHALDAPGCKTLYLDEMDRLAMTNEAQIFFKTLVPQLGTDVRLVLNARVLDYDPWSYIVTAGEAAVVGTGHRSNDLMFTLGESPQPQLDVYGFGQGRAFVNGRAIESWDGALPRNLFFYFIDKPHVTRNEIFQVFWPDLTKKEATNVFHVTKRKITERISRLIQDGHSYELTQYAGGFYVPSDKLVRHYDVQDFEDAVEQASRTLDEDAQAAHYRRAVTLYRAPFLRSVRLPWVQERREKLRLQFTEALTGLAALCQKAGDYPEALGYYIRALRQATQREDLYRNVMNVYWLLNRPADALEVYRTLEERLHQTLGVAPARETRALYEQIRQAM